MYNLVEALPYYCLLACLEMVAKSKGYKIDQKSLAARLNVTTSDQEQFNLGVQVVPASIKKVFDDLGCRSHEINYLRAKEYTDWMFLEELNAALNSEKHVICTLSAGKFYSNPSSLDVGHAVLVESIKLNKIKVLDPGPKTTGILEVDVDDLHSASKARDAGLLVIR